MADQPRGGQLRVALDELHAAARRRGDRPQQRGLARAGRPVEHDVAALLQRDGEDLRLPAKAHDGVERAGQEVRPAYGHVSARG
jgi:hypothetical protein